MNPSTIPVTPPLVPVRRRSDSRPWYRQFWPWFLIALPAASVILSFATLYIATSHADAVVPHEGDDSSFSIPNPVRSGSARTPADRVADGKNGDREASRDSR